MMMMKLIHYCVGGVMKDYNDVVMMMMLLLLC